MKLLNYFFFSLCIILINSLVDSEGWQQPKNLSQIKILYDSGKRQRGEKPIVAYSNIYYLYNDYINVYNLNTQEENILPIGKNIKPILYTDTIFSFCTLFFTKDYSIYLYEEDGKKTFEYENRLKEIKINNLGSSYDTLRIYYDHKTKYAAIYNFEQNQNIIILDFKKTKSGAKDIVITIDNGYYVHQSLIYSNYKNDKSLLIVSDGQGIKFYNLKGYANTFWSDNVGKLVKYSNLGFYGFIDFIDGNKVIWSLSNYFRVFELENINEVSQKNNFLPGDNLTECILGLKDGKVLVGSNHGYIYLIEYKYGDLSIIDSRKLCDSLIESISYTDNCMEGTIFCYTFAANCHKIIVFQIGISDDLSDSFLVFLIFLALLVISLIYVYIKKCKE